MDEEQDRENTSIENQCAIITDYAKRRFPDATLELFQDRDRSGYTFEQRPGYQAMRRGLMGGTASILIVKDFSRFARRNSRGLVELEDLRDTGVRIISIGDNIDFPTEDEWLQIQFRFLLNEMPVTDTSKKVRGIVEHRQKKGEWICAVPYGYRIRNWSAKTIEVDEVAASVVQKIFELYLEGWGYKKISNWLTEQHIPTPRTLENEYRLAAGDPVRRQARPQWSIATVQGILTNDFYIGTLRQRKYRRIKINGSDQRTTEKEQLVFQSHHTPIIEEHTFTGVQEQMKMRTKTNYRGTRKYSSTYSGLLRCGDCGAPMFSMSRPDLSPAYTCGTYHRRGRAGCTSHHIRVELLDELLKRCIERVRNNSSNIIAGLEETLRDSTALERSQSVSELLMRELESVRQQLKAAKKQKIRDISLRPERGDEVSEIYAEIEDELEQRMSGLKNQLDQALKKKDALAELNRTSRTVFSVFDDILAKPSLERVDIELFVDEIRVCQDCIDVRLKPDIDALIREEQPYRNDKTSLQDAVFSITEENGIQVVQKAFRQTDKIFNVNIVSRGDPLEIYTDRDGGVIFKKYSLMGGINDFADQLCETLYKTTNRVSIITDRDTCIAVSGVSKRELSDKRISPELEGIMEARQIYQRKERDSAVPICDDTDKFLIDVAAPILSGGDVLGCVIFSAGPNDPPSGDAEYKLVQATSAFLGRHMET